jgi:glycosyltransferase involved in cell wall biosynthesis
MNKINIIQFMPYFPPHKWGVETVWEEIGKYWIKNGFWEFVNVVSEFEQSPLSISPNGRDVEQVIFKWEVIWYKKDWYEILVCPSIEIINNFPVYKIWNKKYKLIIEYLREKTSPQPSPKWEGVEQKWIVITHTRFFLTSFIWWLFARKNKIKWIHIEHW